MDQCSDKTNGLLPSGSFYWDWLSGWVLLMDFMLPSQMRKQERDLQTGKVKSIQIITSHTEKSGMILGICVCACGLHIGLISEQCQASLAFSFLFSFLFNSIPPFLVLLFYILHSKSCWISIITQQNKVTEIRLGRRQEPIYFTVWEWWFNIQKRAIIVNMEHLLFSHLCSLFENFLPRLNCLAF